jgi:hypothetical protein
MSELNPLNRGQILKDLVALRKAVGGLKAEQRQGVAYKVKDASVLMDKIREAGDELGMVMMGAPVNSVSYDVPGFEVYNKNAGKLVPQLVVHTTVTVRFMASDGSYVDFVGSGHGSSNDDKAGGKASTYAWKDAIIKALSLPNADLVDTDDEQVPMERKPFNFKKGK